VPQFELKEGVSEPNLCLQEEALAAAELEELEFEAREAEAEAAELAEAAASLQEIVPAGIRMEIFYALPEPGLERDTTSEFACRLIYNQAPLLTGYRKRHSCRLG
jgi:hypothetical protein